MVFLGGEVDNCPSPLTETWVHRPVPSKCTILVALMVREAGPTQGAQTGG